jgi:hypothetical protein
MAEIDVAALAQSVADSVGAVGAPKRTKTDAIEVEQHSLADQIAATKFAAAASVGSNPFAALRYAQAVPSSPMGQTYTPEDSP